MASLLFFWEVQMEIIETEELKNKCEQDREFIFINALPEKEYEQAHIPGSDNFPFHHEGFEEKVQALADSREDEIIIYSADENCPVANKAAERLEKAGFTHVKVYKGGMKAWENANYEVAQVA